MVLVSAAQWGESATYIYIYHLPHVPPPPRQPLGTIPPLLIITEHQAELPGLREQVLTSYLSYRGVCILFSLHLSIKSQLKV